MGFLPFLILYLHLFFVYGEEIDNSKIAISETSVETRQDGIMRDLVNLLVEEKREREELRKQIHEVKEQIDILKNNSGNSNKEHRVWFSAFHTKVRYILGIIKFERVANNYGNGYNKDTGIFICKIPGLYLFHLSILAKDRDASADITKNGSRVVHVYTSRDNIWNSGSGMALLKLKRGDTVYILSHDRIYFHSSGTNFMGLLISADK